MIGLHGQHINLFIEPGPSLGPVLEVTVDDLADAKQRLVEQGCEVVKDEPDFSRCHVKDPFGLIYNLAAARLPSSFRSDPPTAGSPRVHSSIQDAAR
jgi:hypothetical protein